MQVRIGKFYWGSLSFCFMCGIVCKREYLVNCCKLYIHRSYPLDNATSNNFRYRNRLINKFTLSNFYRVMAVQAMLENEYIHS